MNDIFDIRFSFEQIMKEKIILKFSNKQGGDFNVFSYHWQCFAWAAIIGFLKEKRKPLDNKVADKPFSLRTMMNNDGEKIVEALICMCISKSGNLDILKDPEDAILMINEYANGGFYYIEKMLEQKPISNDLEWVKQEILSRGLDDVIFEDNELSEENDETNSNDDETAMSEEDFAIQNASFDQPSNDISSRRWRVSEKKEAKSFFDGGMSIEKLAKYFGKDEESVTDVLRELGVSI